MVKVIACETGFLDYNPDLSAASRLVASKLFLGLIPTSFKGFYADVTQLILMESLSLYVNENEIRI